MNQIKYIGALFDQSGYAEAARNNVVALLNAGVEVLPVSVTFEKTKANLGPMAERLNTAMGKKDESKIQIIHLTPENYPRCIDSNKYNIGYTTFETSKLPSHWPGLINKLDEVWVPCNHNLQVFKDSGVTIPIYVVPHCLKEESVSQSEITIVNKKPNDFVFYSIFQWTERKAPIQLLKAYLTEFKEDENVVLAIKTYFINPGNSQETEQLKEAIAQLKKRLYMSSFPRILLISSSLSRQQIQALHKESDCYISLTRCEGFGLPFAEAMLAGKPIIGCTYGGQSDLIIDHSTGLAVNYTMTPCHGMPWPIYTGLMDWAEPDISHAKKQMRYMFENKNKAQEMGQRAKKHILNNFNYELISTTMKERLEQINL